MSKIHKDILTGKPSKLKNVVIRFRCEAEFESTFTTDARHFEELKKIIKENRFINDYTHKRWFHIITQLAEFDCINTVVDLEELEYELRPDLPPSVKYFGYDSQKQNQ